MKFNVGDILYYINPFVFTIEKVKIDFIHSFEDGTIGYVEQTGAYLAEEDLLDNLQEATNKAIAMLNKFYQKRYDNLMQRNDPEIFMEDDLWN